jgi:ribose transport system substrate-binding protein
MHKALTLIFTLALLVGGCSGRSDTSATASATTSPAVSSASTGPNSSQTKTIGVSVQDREARFYQDMESGLKNEASKYGYAVVVVDAAHDNAKQQSQVEDFISQRVLAIILTPTDSRAIGSAIVEANKAGIPVFTADVASLSKQGKIVSHIASDNVAGGRAAASLMCAAVPGKVGGIAIIDQPELTSVQDRVKGFRSGIASGCPSVTIVSDVDGGGQRSKASSAMDDILQSHKQLKGVFGINDDSALGAAKSIEAAGLKGKVVVVGYDASPEARTAIGLGSMYGDAIQHPDQIGSKTIDAIHDYFSGKTPPPTISVPVGTYTKADAGK